jgi:hypothetical protein
MSEAIVPKFFNQTNSVRIREREYLGDIVASATQGLFQNQVYPLTPQNSQTFPWLSQIAILYEQWYPHGLVFEFVSTSSEYNGSSQALGTVVMATDYNAADAPYNSKYQMENEDYSNSTKPSCSAVHGIECDPKQRPLEMMYTNQSTATQVQFTTLGNFQLATNGTSTASTVLGELWVSYDISFFKKSIQNSAIVSFNMTGVPTLAGPLFGSPVFASTNTGSIAYSAIVGSSQTLTFSTVGYYLMVVSIATASTVGTWTHNGNLTLLPGTGYSTSAVGYVATVYFQVTLPGATFTFPSSGVAAGTGISLSISSITSAAASVQTTNNPNNGNLP